MGDNTSFSVGSGLWCVVDITDVRAVAGVITEEADVGVSTSKEVPVICGGGMRSAGFGKVLKVDPREV